jgi:hypothetical protein
MKRSGVLLMMILSSASFAPAAQETGGDVTIEVYKSPT